MSDSKTTASELADAKSEVDLLTRHLLMWMKAITDGEHGVITIDCDFIKRLVAELRRLEEENGMLTSAIRSPELYVGIVTEQLEQERNDWAVLCKKKQERIAELTSERNNRQSDNDELRCQIVNERYQFETRIAELEEQLEGMNNARNRFCAAVNAIANTLGHTDKQCYAPEAVVRWAEEQRERIAELESEAKVREAYIAGCMSVLKEPTDDTA